MVAPIAENARPLAGAPACRTAQIVTTLTANANKTASCARLCKAASNGIRMAPQGALLIFVVVRGDGYPTEAASVASVGERSDVSGR